MKRAQGYPILVVEDSLEDFDTVCEAARRLGVPNDLVHAPDAENAHQRLEELTGSAGAFAFVLLDQSLPGTNGDGFLREIRKRPEFQILPVVVLSGSTSLTDCNKCYEAGANAYHVKPVRFDEHLSTVQSIFRYWLQMTTLPARQQTHRLD
jgi:CheY-like chemotaxis protein